MATAVNIKLFDVCKKYEFQVIAGGGIRNMEDVRTVLQCGADAVQIASTAMFGKYDVIREYATL